MLFRVALSAMLFTALGACTPKPAFTAPAPEPSQQTNIDPSPTRPSPLTLDQRKFAIDLELAAMDRAALPADDWAKAWAGTYYTGDGLGKNVVISIAPHWGVTYTWHGCMGLYDSAQGDIIEPFPGGLHLSLFPGQHESFYNFMSPTLYFVRWGDRQYCVPEGKLQSFVDNYNRGGYYRSAMFDIPRKFEGRDVLPMEMEAPKGKPQLPPEYAKLLADRHIVFKIIESNDAVGEDSSPHSKHFRVTVNAGRDQQVSVGLSINDETGGFLRFFEIDTVNEQTSTGQLDIYSENKDVPASPVGMTFDYRDTK